MASGASWHADVERETAARVRRGAEATWQPVGDPRDVQGEHRAQPHGRRPRDHADPRGRPYGVPRGRGLADGGPTGIVGHG